MRRLMELPLTLLEMWRVLRVLPRVESSRRSRGPRELVALVRQTPPQLPRSERSRRCLQRAIRWVDRWFADGGNCYRRAMLEMTLDPQAAERPLYMGFSVEDRGLTGHAWLAANEPNPDRYDFVIQL